MTRTTFLSIAAASLIGLASAPVSANTALYDAPPPDDAVFVRWLNTSATPAALGVDLAPTDAAPAEFGHFPASASDAVSAGAHFSVVANAVGTAHLVEEPARDALGKVHLVLVNAADVPVRVMVADGGPEVIAATAPLTSGLRAVNPVAATLTVENVETGAVMGTAALALQRGQDVTILVTSESVEVIEDAFGAGPLLD